METVYIPYSVRENVRDERLHSILNYIERVIAWDIKFQYTDTDNWIIGTQDYKWIIGCFGWMCDIHMNGKNLSTRLHQDVLLDVYTSLLPVIRDKSK